MFQWAGSIWKWGRRIKSKQFVEFEIKIIKYNFKNPKYIYPDRMDQFHLWLIRAIVPYFPLPPTIIRCPHRHLQRATVHHYGLPPPLTCRPSCLRRVPLLLPPLVLLRPRLLFVFSILLLCLLYCFVVLWRKVRKIGTVRCHCYCGQANRRKGRTISTIWRKIINWDFEWQRTP